MKIRIISATLLICTWIMTGCSYEHEPQSDPGKISFSFNELSAIDDGKIGYLNTPAKLFISIETSSSNTIYDLKELKLLKFGDVFISEELQFVAGNYRVLKFFITDENNNVLYATPKKGSMFENLVERPLPIEFSISGDEVKTLEMEVISVINNQSTDFGYASFGIRTIRLTALTIPPFEETITKISCQFSSTEKQIIYEGVPVNSVINLNNIELLDKAWDTKIYIWIEPTTVDCYPKVYRYKGELTFNGSVINLPPLEDPCWTKMFYSEKDNFKIYRSIDPRSSYDVEVYLPANFLNCYYGFVDKGTWGESDEQLCGMKWHEFYGNPESGNFEISFPVDTDCHIYETNYIIDSYLFFDISTTSAENILFEDYFSWKINNDVVEYCQ